MDSLNSSPVFELDKACANPACLKPLKASSVKYCSRKCSIEIMKSRIWTISAVEMQNLAIRRAEIRQAKREGHDVIETHGDHNSGWARHSDPNVTYR